MSLAQFFLWECEWIATSFTSRREKEAIKPSSSDVTSSRPPSLPSSKSDELIAPLLCILQKGIRCVCVRGSKNVFYVRLQRRFGPQGREDELTKKGGGALMGGVGQLKA